MTAQAAERLRYLGQEHAMCSQPLDDYFLAGGACPDLAFSSTALWRCYLGSWEILDDRLYLIALRATSKDGSAVNLATVFPGFPDRVFAHWYSGLLRLPQGRLIKYVHGGFASVHESDLFVVIEQGRVTDSHARVNGQAVDPAAPVGYAPGAWTEFSSRRLPDEEG